MTGKVYIGSKLKSISWIIIISLFFYITVENAEGEYFYRDVAIRKDLSTNSEKEIEAGIFKKGDSFAVKTLSVNAFPVDYYKSYETLKGNVYNGTVISFSEKVLGYFIADNIRPTICVDDFKLQKSEGMRGCSEAEEGLIYLQIPYFPNGKYADVYDLDGKKILTIDLSVKATCNENGMCEHPLEDGLNCSSDCSVDTPVLDNSGADGYAKKTDILPKRNFWQRIGPYMLTGSLLFFLVIMGIYMKKRRDGQKLSQL